MFWLLTLCKVQTIFYILLTSHLNLNTLFGIQKVSNINILHQLFIYFYHLACECFIIKNHHRSWQVKGCKIIPIFKRSWHIVLYLQYHGASVLEVSSKRPRTKATPDLREIIKTRKNSGECFSMFTVYQENI